MKNDKILSSKPKWENAYKGEDDKFYGFFEEQIRKADYWDGTMKRWDAKQIFDKLRSLGIGVTKNDFLELAEDSVSAYQVFKEWMTEFAKNPKFVENFGLGMAAARVLWLKLLPDLTNLEMILDAKDRAYMEGQDRTMYEFCRTWHQLFSDLLDILPEDMQMFQEIKDLYSNPTWFENWISDFSKHWRNACLEQGKLLPEFEQWQTTLLKRFLEAKVFSLEVLRNEIWIALVKGEEEKAERALVEFNILYPDSMLAYSDIGDYYYNPPSFGLTAPDPVKGAEYYNKSVSTLTKGEE